METDSLRRFAEDQLKTSECDIYCRPFELYGSASHSVAVIVGERPATTIRQSEISSRPYTNLLLDNRLMRSFILKRDGSLSKTRKKIEEVSQRLQTLGWDSVIVTNKYFFPKEVNSQYQPNTLAELLCILQPNIILCHGEPASAAIACGDVLGTIGAFDLFARWGKGNFESRALPKCHVGSYMLQGGAKGELLVTRHLSHYINDEIDLLYSILTSLK